MLVPTYRIASNGCFGLLFGLLISRRTCLSIGTPKDEIDFLLPSSHLVCVSCLVSLLVCGLFIGKCWSALAVGTYLPSRQVLILGLESGLSFDGNYRNIQWWQRWDPLLRTDVCNMGSGSCCVSVSVSLGDGWFFSGCVPLKNRYKGSLIPL